MEYEIKRDGVSLFCRREGAGSPVLLIHGVACDSDFFRDASRILSKHYTVLSFDRRGCSRSTTFAAETDFSVRTQAEDAAAVILDYAKQPVFVVGCSAGGAVAALLAKQHPELVTGLFLHEPLLMGDGALRIEQDAFWEKLRLGRVQNRTIRCMLQFVRAMGGVDRSRGSLPMERQQQNLKNLELFLERELESFAGLEAAQLTIDPPVTVAVGTEDRDGLFRRSAVRAAELRGWRLIEVPGYHNFALDQPECFAKITSCLIEEMCYTGQ